MAKKKKQKQKVYHSIEDRVNDKIKNVIKQARSHKSKDKNLKMSLRKHAREWDVTEGIKDFHETSLYGRGRDETIERKEIFNTNSDAFIRSQLVGQIINYEKMSGKQATASTIRRLMKQQIERNIQRRYHHAENILDLLGQDRKTMNQFKDLIGVKSVKDIDLSKFEYNQEENVWTYDSDGAIIVVKPSPLRVYVM